MIRTRCNEMFSYLNATITGNPNALHDMRVSARRLQAVLRLHRECFPDKQYLKVYLPLRALIRSLGIVRELDVLLDWLEQKSRSLPVEERFAFDMLIARNQRVRNKALRSLQTNLKSARESGLKERILDFTSRHL